MVERAPRRPLSRDRILRAAVDVADREGLGALTMRRLGAELGVEAMSLYKHVANKEAILDGIVELIVGQIGIPAEAADWREALRWRAVSARAVLAGHSWAIGLLEARGSMAPAALRSLDSMLGTLSAGGFAIEDAAHAIWLLDSYVYGHVIQESSIGPRETQPAGPDLGGEYPHLGALLESASRSAFSLDGEFEYGLGLILDALQP
jgi:AcrR family transcriptional regulator